ncbi:hypothetical protein HYN56_00890 [Flavobacterium crocinum]|uniref:Uncharacterized protein n=1 Tax=Flavobacterium crocinum TaxID=2183896 RepID=A0A2S1YFL9_9FLAO|nr:hypothetical protein [Flavobacterium crocinum]AWK02843.1 hypothetical protein HYN56_00890 [Flavobacterium crocinum]
MYNLILCEKATGIILELDGKTRFLKSETNSRPFLSFEDIEDAENKANNLISKNDNLEIGMYDSNWNFIKSFSN